MNPQLTIVTITFNNFEQLAASVQSYLPLVQAQPFECLVINGGSDTRTQAYLEKNASEKFRFISEKDDGISDAFSKGALNALGDNVVFINSGDRLVEPGYLENAIAFLNAHPEIDFTFSDLIFEDVALGPTIFRAKPHHRDVLGKGMPYPHPTLVARRRLFTKIGAFRLDYKIGMDYDWVCRLIKNGSRGHYLPYASVLMDGTGVSATHERRAIEENTRALKAHGLLSCRNRLALWRRHTQHTLKALLLKLGFGKTVSAIRRKRHAGAGR